MKQTRIKWTEGMQLDGHAPSGHTVTMDARADVGGKDTGPRPVELLIVGLGGCTSMDVISILRKMRVPFDDFEVEINAEQADEHPKVFTQIELVYRVTGDVPEDKLEKAISLSQERYCSVSAMLGKTAQITYRYEIVKSKLER